MKQNSEKTNCEIKAVIFARVSSKEQGEGHSLDAQIQYCYEYAIKKEFKVIEQFKVIESSLAEGRPEFSKMIEFIKKQKDKIVLVCYSVDRLQRDFDEQYVELQKLIKLDKAEIHYIKDGSVESKGMDSSAKFRKNLDVLLANDYRNRISENVKRSLKKKLNDGEHIGKAPVGYLNVEDGYSKRTIIVDPVRSEFIKQLFIDYSTGLSSFKTLAIKYSKLGLTNNAKSKGIETRVSLNASQIQKVLSDPFYYGMMHHYGDDLHRNGKLYPHKYEKIITKELFDKCQDVMHGRAKSPSKTETKKKFIFSGLVRCSKCNFLFSPEIKKGRFVYLTPNGALRKLCDCKRISEKTLLEEVESRLKQITIPDDVLSHIKDILNEKMNGHKKFNKTRLSELGREKAKLESKIEFVKSKWCDQKINDDEYDQYKIEFANKKIELENQISQMMNEDSMLEVTLTSVLEMSQKIQEMFESSRIEEKTKILNIVFSNLKMDGENPVFIARKPFSYILENGGCIQWLAGRYTSRTKLCICNALFDREFGDMNGYNSNVKRDRVFKVDSNPTQTFANNQLLENIVVFSSNNYKNSFYDLNRNISRYERLS